ncbi:hypothetical protein Tco_0019053 [Tanacetum coccineum]
MSDHNQFDTSSTTDKKALSVKNVSFSLRSSRTIRPMDLMTNPDPVPQTNVFPTADEDRLSQQGKRVLILKNHLLQLLAWKQFGFLLPSSAYKSFPSTQMDVKMDFLLMSLKEGGGLRLAQPGKGFIDPDNPEKVLSF